MIQPQMTNDFIMSMAKSWNPPEKMKKGRKNKLSPYLNAIRYMRSAKHLSYKDIHAFILDSGTKVSYPTLITFVNKNMGKNKSKRK